jgi:hypothetical protein
MGMKDYVPVMTRFKEFMNDNKTKEVLVVTEPVMNWEKEAVYFKATIHIDGKVVSMGHAMAASLGEDKEFEKAETTAVGRALAFLGYEAEMKDVEVSEERSEAPPKRGLGSSKKAAKKVEAEVVENEADEEDETEDEESSDEDDSEKESPKAPEKTGTSSLTNIMSKYGLKNKGA